MKGVNSDKTEKKIEKISDHKRVAASDAKASPQNAQEQNSAPLQIVDRDNREKQDKQHVAASTSKPPKTGGKSKSKTDKPTEDELRLRLDRMEGLLGKFVDMMEQPDLSDDDGMEYHDNSDHDDKYDYDLSDNADDEDNFSHWPLISKNKKSAKSKTSKGNSGNHNDFSVTGNTPVKVQDKDSVGELGAGESDDKSDLGFAANYAVHSGAQGEPLEAKTAQSIKYLLANKLQERAMQETLDKYPTPNNCDTLDVPRVRPAIWDSVSSSARSKDLKLQRIQKPLTKGITALAQCFPKDKPMTSAQQDAVAMLCNANYELNCLRKDYFKPEMNTRFTHLCKPSVPVTTWLFGDNLSSQVKELNEEQKTTTGMMRKQRLPSRRFNPYNNRRRNMQRYFDAGWLPRNHNANRAPREDRPFLGQHRLSQMRRRFQATKSSNKKTTQARKGE